MLYGFCLLSCYPASIDSVHDLSLETNISTAGKMRAEIPAGTTLYAQRTLPTSYQDLAYAR
jgi:hypothetical protein